MKNTVTKLLFLLLCANLTAFAQIQRAAYSEVYPELPFSVSQLNKFNYQKVVVWYDEFTKGENDESGMPWSNMVKSYQRERHIMPGGQLERSGYYTPENLKLSAFQYYYIGNKISVIDQIGFDSLQNDVVLYSYQFAYKDTIPFQKVKLHSKDKQFRMLYDYLYDAEGRLIREQVTTHGKAKKLETVLGVEDDNVMVLTAYNGDTKTKRFYKNMHDLQKTERIQYNENGQPINTKIKDGQNKLIADIVYSYEGEILVKETHTTNDGTQLVDDKIVHYRYNADGLLEQIITEKGELQTIVSFQYSEDY